MPIENDPSPWPLATENQGKGRETFEKAVQGEQAPEQTQDGTDQGGDSDFDKPFPHPRPHGMGEEEIDRQSFDNRQAQKQAHAAQMQAEMEQKQEAAEEKTVQQEFNGVGSRSEDNIQQNAVDMNIASGLTEEERRNSPMGLVQSPSREDGQERQHGVGLVRPMNEDIELEQGRDGTEIER